jgi:hypothetical protein
MGLSTWSKPAQPTAICLIVKMPAKNFLSWQQIFKPLDAVG